MYLIFYNPIAGGGDGLKALEEVKEIVKDKEYLAYSVLEHSKQLDDIVKNTKNLEKIIVVGGDGTLSCFINQVDVKNHWVSFYQGGTGNDFMRNFIDLDNDNLVDYSLSVDKAFCQVNDKTIKVVNALGVGVDGLITKIHHEDKTRGKKSYVMNTIKGLLRYKRSDIELEIDGVNYQFKKCYLVAITNGKYFGGGMKICPDAIINDNLLDVCVVHNISLFRLLLAFPSVFKGLHAKKKSLKKKVFYTQGKIIKYQAKEARYLQHDGELHYEQIKEFTVNVNE